MFYFLVTHDDKNQGSDFAYKLWRYSLLTGRRLPVDNSPIFQGIQHIRLIPEQEMLVYITHSTEGIPQVVYYDLLTSKQHVLHEAPSDNPPECIQVSMAYNIYFTNESRLLVYDAQKRIAGISLEHPINAFTVAPVGTRICYAKEGLLYTLRYRIY